MELIGISLTEFRSLQQKIDELKILITSKEHNSGSSRLLTNEDLITTFKISRETAKKWRQKNYIPFIKIGRKIFYDERDVVNSFKKHSFSRLRGQK